MKQPIRFAIDDSLTAFQDSHVIGTKVLDRNKFMNVLEGAVLDHDPESDRQPGQHFIVLPETAYHLVSAGDGKSSPCTADYCLRLHRGVVQKFLVRGVNAQRKERAGKVNFLACAVYTRKAYLADPELDPTAEMRIHPEATHVIVAVIGASGGEPPVPPWRFICNMAGGNNETLDLTADELREQAKAIRDYYQNRDVVADAY